MSHTRWLQHARSSNNFYHVYAIHRGSYLETKFLQVSGDLYTYSDDAYFHW